MRNDIEKHFAGIGAGVEVTSLRARDRRIGRQWITRRMSETPMLVDVRRQGREEHFTITQHSDTDVKVIDASVSMRHLVLTAKARHEPATRTFLCGRDESHLFVAAIPERSSVRTVGDAMNALKPPTVWESIRLHNLPESQWNLRRTAAFVRQGEWFFVPRSSEDGRSHQVLRHEPLSRGLGSQMHWCEEMFRDGGQVVWVNHRHPNGLTERQYVKLPERERQTNNWRQMRRGAIAYARGQVRHPDHVAVTLDGWHEVAMNTEAQAAAMRHVTFLD